MSYLPSALLVVLGLVLLVLIFVHVVKALRGFRRTVSMVSTNAQDRTGLLRARSAALRVAIDERRGVRSTK
ncbi:bacteriophage holin [Amycolatopsis sp. CA-230715]|uniref:bacteriophage holin n=1 Tax=Amycolatopsis sp. CA-230715 TaxID=2745196 RepID=UPI001C016FEE|nr:bacteriophage holin [Amycolatopsis sp. CA-230715]QWF85438.1 hypothetical protein HUW46_08892 [Amycolatopsis sp. CA-230715]